MHIKLTECTLHEKNLMTVPAKLTKGSENPSVFFEFCNKYSVSVNCVCGGIQLSFNEFY